MIAISLFSNYKKSFRKKELVDRNLTRPFPFQFQMAAVFKWNKVRQDRSSEAKTRGRVWNGRIGDNFQCYSRGSSFANSFLDECVRRNLGAHSFRFVFQIVCQSCWDASFVDWEILVAALNVKILWFVKGKCIRLLACYFLLWNS